MLSDEGRSLRLQVMVDATMQSQERVAIHFARATRRRNVRRNFPKRMTVCASGNRGGRGDSRESFRLKARSGVGIIPNMSQPPKLGWMCTQRQTFVFPLGVKFTYDRGWRKRAKKG